MSSLKEIRKSKNITQKDLAKLIGMTQSSVAKFETNTREPDIKTLFKLSEILDTDLETIAKCFLNEVVVNEKIL